MTLACRWWPKVFLCFPWSRTRSQHQLSSRTLTKRIIILPNGSDWQHHNYQHCPSVQAFMHVVFKILEGTSFTKYKNISISQYRQHSITKNPNNFYAGIHRHARGVQDFGCSSFSEDVSASQYGLCCQEGYIPSLRTDHQGINIVICDDKVMKNTQLVL